MTSTGNRSSTHNLNVTMRLDISSQGPLFVISDVLDSFLKYLGHKQFELDRELKTLP